MRYAHGLGALLVVLGSASHVQAQFAIGGFGYTRSVWGGGFVGGPRVVGYSVSVGGFNGYTTGGIPGGGFYAPRPVYAVGVPVGYPPPGVSSIAISGSAIQAPQPIVIQQPAPQPIIIQQQAPQPIIIQQPVVIAPNLADPIIIRPRGQADAPGAKPAKLEEKKPEEKKPEKKPAEEKINFLVLGKQAFADREHARAVRFFKQATEANPKDGLAFFLLAQAQFAVGKYREAVVSIHEGLRLEKDWPRSKFRPLELYGPNPGDFTDHMDQLQAALKAHPGDAVLLFLYGYELWFDGREDEVAGAVPQGPQTGGRAALH